MIEEVEEDEGDNSKVNMFEEGYDDDLMEKELTQKPLTS